MPNVGGVQYPYTPQGVAAAQQAERQIGKMGPAFGGGGWGGLVGDPFISPGLLELVRQGRQPTFSDVSHRPERPAPAWYGGAGMFGNLIGGVSGPSLVDMVRANTQNPLPQQGQPTFRDVSHRPEQPTFRDVSHRPQSWKDQMLNKLRGIGAIPGQVTQGQSPWYRPIAQAPRGQTIRTTDPGAGYGHPSGPTAQRPRQPANYSRSPSNPNRTPGG